MGVTKHFMADDPGVLWRDLEDHLLVLVAHQTLFGQALVYYL